MGKADSNNKYEPNEIEPKWLSDASSFAKASEDKKAMEGKQVYNPNEIEAKWQEKWESDKIFSPDIDNAKNPFYNLMMFPYPSAEGLHVGNMYAFTGADVHARFKRMQGNDVFEPIGLDGFGIHSENYAIKVGRHPKEQAKLAEKNFYRQLRSIGNSFDWQRTVETYDPAYYKWTQWLFIQLFRAGLAYRKKAEVNWCPKDLTVLSDEQVIEARPPGTSSAGEVGRGKCERCGSEVEKKELEQWFFRITNYAERLLGNIDSLNWSEKVKIAQRNWIGKSEGAEVEFKIENSEFRIKVFTTRPDTLYGATFMVVAPEHSLVEAILNFQFSISNEKVEEVRKYVEKVKEKTDIERTAEGKQKSGVVTGLFALNPVNSKKIPILVSDYVLSSYGTGAIMAVPAHDQRDFETAKKFNLEIIPVIQPKPQTINHNLQANAYIGEGFIIGSDEWNGFHVPEDIPKVIDWLEKKGIGKRKVNFHLRDWLISRQRYWGPPIPMIFCSKCSAEGKSWFSNNESVRAKNNESRIKKQESRKDENHNSKLMIHDSISMPGWFPVPEADLPVLLPDVEDWRPGQAGSADSTGSLQASSLHSGGQARQATGPLANHPEFYKTTCPNCGGEARRETDVSDTFLDSAWYFLRYPSLNADLVGPAAPYPHSSSLPRTSFGLRVDNGGPPVASPTSENLPFDPKITRRWLPVDQYIGGAEHAVLHLLYSRFITMALHDMGFVDFEEPFSKFYAHGLIIKDGAKMSKSKGNVVVPDEYIKKYGADALRTYLMFLGPYSDGGDFRDSGIEGMNRFIRKVWKLFSDSSFSGPAAPYPHSSSLPRTSFGLRVDNGGPTVASHERIRIMHKTIQRVTNDISEFGYNTAIAAMMEWYNYLNSNVRAKGIEITRVETETYLRLIAPFAPHIAEELFQFFRSQNSKLKSQNFESIHLQPWPEFDEKLTEDSVITIVVQVNGKKRGEIHIKNEIVNSKGQIEREAKEAVLKYLEGQNIRKTFYVPGKIVNFVV